MATDNLPQNPSKKQQIKLCYFCKAGRDPERPALALVVGHSATGDSSGVLRHVWVCAQCLEDSMLWLWMKEPRVIRYAPDPEQPSDTVGRKTYGVSELCNTIDIKATPTGAGGASGPADDAPRGTTALDALLNHPDLAYARTRIAAWQKFAPNTIPLDAVDALAIALQAIDLLIVERDEAQKALIVAKLGRIPTSEENTIGTPENAAMHAVLGNPAPAQPSAPAVAADTTVTQAEYMHAQLLKVGDSILRHDTWHKVVGVKRDGDVVHVTVNDRITPLPYHGNQELAVITAKVADAAQRSPTRAKQLRVLPIRQLVALEKLLLDGVCIVPTPHDGRWLSNGSALLQKVSKPTFTQLLTHGWIEEDPTTSKRTWRITEAGRKAVSR